MRRKLQSSSSNLLQCKVYRTTKGYHSAQDKNEKVLENHYLFLYKYQHSSTLRKAPMFSYQKTIKRHDSYRNFKIFNPFV